MSNVPPSSPAESPAWLDRLRCPIDIAGLAYYRVAFGLGMMLNVWWHLSKGSIRQFWIDPEFHFNFYGFEWLSPLPGDGMLYHFVALEVLALFITIGLWYRVSMTLFFLGFAYAFLTAEAYYQNHNYLICLISFLMIFVPADRAASVDAWRRPSLRSGTAPAWSLWALRGQIGIVYFYGGIAKLHTDWLVGRVMQIMLRDSANDPLVGPYVESEWLAQLCTWGGLGLDLLIVPLLIWRRTRIPAFLVALAFHVTNSRLFEIGIFPWFMIASTALYFSPDWPRRFFRSRAAREQAERTNASAPAAPLTPAGRLGFMLLGLYFLVQALLPLQHHLYPGNVHWTEEGSLFAWHMKLNNKSVNTYFVVTVPSMGTTRTIDPREYMPDWQYKRMAVSPDRILQYSHYIADQMRRAGYSDVQVRARAVAGLNGRPSQDLVDPTVDLAAQRRTLGPAGWIVPLKHPLPTRAEYRKQREIARRNRERGEAYLAANAKRAAVEVLPSGLQYEVLQAGSGPVPEPTDRVRVHYRNFRIDGTQFGNSYDANEPVVQPVFAMLPGWAEALQRMAVGSKWRLHVPPELAHGQWGFGDSIGPNETLVFELELLGIVSRDRAESQASTSTAPADR